MAGVLDEKAKFLDTISNEEDKETKKKDDWREKKVEFECQICHFKEKCHFFGKKPKFVKNLVEFKEDTYVMLDPFTPRDNRTGNMFLVLGAHCAQCRVQVCCDCSLFYSRRFCVNCCQFYSAEFPEEIRTRISKLVETQEQQEKDRNG